MFFNSFPKKLCGDLQHVLKIIPTATYNNVSVGCSENVVSYINHNHTVEFPYRIYFVDVDDVKANTLTNIQKEILCCIYTRSCNGYVREKYLNVLLSMDFDFWAIPFIVKLCDEYVVELLELVYDRLHQRDNGDIKRFCDENRAAIKKSYTRMISYWNEYYRNREPHFRGYVGRKVFREILGYNRTFDNTVYEQE